MTHIIAAYREEIAKPGLLRENRKKSEKLPEKRKRTEPIKKVVYPESDGKPMADNTKQFEWIVKIKEGLEILFRNQPDVFVAGDFFWYPVQGSNRIRVAPDAMVVFGRPKGHRGSYLQWKEENIAPQVVFEILSPGNRAGEMQKKLRFYEKYGVEEYYLYDPDNIRLSGWTRCGRKLCPIANMQGWISPRLKIRFEIGEDDLRVFGPDGQKFLTPPEIQEKVEQEKLWAEQEKQRAKKEKLRADKEKQRAEKTRLQFIAERERAERLAAKLRELGISPEAI